MEVLYQAIHSGAATLQLPAMVENFFPWLDVLSLIPLFVRLSIQQLVNKIGAWNVFFAVLLNVLFPRWCSAPRPLRRTAEVARWLHNFTTTFSIGLLAMIVCMALTYNTTPRLSTSHATTTEETPPHIPDEVSSTLADASTTTRERSTTTPPPPPCLDETTRSSRYQFPPLRVNQHRCKLLSQITPQLRAHQFDKIELLSALHAAILPERSYNPRFQYGTNLLTTLTETDLHDRHDVKRMILTLNLPATAVESRITESKLSMLSPLLPQNVNQLRSILQIVSVSHYLAFVDPLEFFNAHFFMGFLSGLTVTAPLKTAIQMLVDQNNDITEIADLLRHHYDFGPHVETTPLGHVTHPPSTSVSPPFVYIDETLQLQNENNSSPTTTTSSLHEETTSVSTFTTTTEPSSSETDPAVDRSPPRRADSHAQRTARLHYF